MKEIRNWEKIEEGKVAVTDMSVTYAQNADTNDSAENIQCLKFSAIPGDTFGLTYNPDEQYFYYNLEIEPNEDGTPGHWSFEDIDEIIVLFNNFKERLMLNKKIRKDEKW